MHWVSWNITLQGRDIYLSVTWTVAPVGIYELNVCMYFIEVTHWKGIQWPVTKSHVCWKLEPVASSLPWTSGWQMQVRLNHALTFHVSRRRSDKMTSARGDRYFTVRSLNSIFRWRNHRCRSHNRRYIIWEALMHSNIEILHVLLIQPLFINRDTNASHEDPPLHISRYCLTATNWESAWYQQMQSKRKFDIEVCISCISCSSYSDSHEKTSPARISH